MGGCWAGMVLRPCLGSFFCAAVEPVLRGGGEQLLEIATLVWMGVDTNANLGNGCLQPPGQRGGPVKVGLGQEDGERAVAEMCPQV